MFLAVTEAPASSRFRTMMSSGAPASSPLPVNGFDEAAGGNSIEKFHLEFQLQILDTEKKLDWLL